MTRAMWLQLLGAACLGLSGGLGLVFFGHGRLGQSLLALAAGLLLTLSVALAYRKDRAYRAAKRRSAP